MRCRGARAPFLLIASRILTIDAELTVASDLPDGPSDGVVCLLQEQPAPLNIRHSALHTEEPAVLSEAAHLAVPGDLKVPELKIPDDLKAVLAKEEACPTNTTDLLLRGAVDELEKKVKTIDMTSDIVMLVLTSASLVLLLMGGKLVLPSVFTIVALAVFYVVFEIMIAGRSLLEKQGLDTCILPLAVAGVAGLLCGGVALTLLKQAFFVVGMVGGAIIAFQLEETVVALVSKAADFSLLQYYWIVIIVAAFAGGATLYRLREDAFAVATSLIGAFGFEIGVRGSLAAMAEYNLSPVMSLVLMAVAFVVGCLVQLCSLHSK